MSFKKVTRNILIGKDTFIASRAEYKSAILRGQMAFVSIFVFALYIGIDSYNGISNFTGFYLLGISIATISIFLNRHSYYQSTNFLLLTTANFLAYVFASNDTYRAGTYIYLIVCCLLAFALYGYKYRIAAVLFCLVSVLLFFLSYVYEVKMFIHSPEVQKLIYAEEYVRVSFITNFLIALVLCSLIFHFLLSINFHSENEILVKNDLLSKTNQELDRFVYSASHDLKAPLSSMLGLIEVAQRTDDPEEIKMCLGMMRGRINILDDFIREIIDYSRNARLELKKDKFSLLELTKEVVDGLKYAEGFENIYLKYNMPADLEVETDRARLRVVLSNLIGNSLKYHDPAKENPNVEISAVSRNNQLRIEVQDNGLGISEEHKPKIFDMFFRASEKSKGSGLGLYIVNETIKKLNGTVVVASKVGHGSTFEIVVPLS
jgi:signal transduction histidine kinase